MRKVTSCLLDYFNKRGKKIVLSGSYSLATWYDVERYAPDLLTDVCFLEIKNPNKEECKSILRYWIAKEGYEKYEINEEMIEFIADIGTTNVRILQGTLTKVIAVARLERQSTITMQILKKIFEVE